MSAPNVNRLALTYLADLQGIPQTVVEVAAYVTGRLHRPALEKTALAMQTLETLGLIERAQTMADAEPMWKITAAGLRQALRQVPAAQLDPMVWG
jgi:hypothetical protein